MPELEGGAVTSDGQEGVLPVIELGDVDLKEKLEEGQNFYNYHRPHSALAGKTPYEVLREKLNLHIAEAKVE